MATAVMATTGAACGRSLHASSASGGLSPARTTSERPNTIINPAHQLRHHAGAGQRQRAERQIAAEREHDDPERDEDAAGDVIGADDQALSFPFPRASRGWGVVRGEGARDAAQMVCTIRRAIGL